jgi:hypothetical protein
MQKVAREKCQLLYKGKPFKQSGDFSTEALRARRTWNNVLQALKENNYQPRITVSFIIEGEIKIFTDKPKLEKFMSTKIALQKIFKRILLRAEEDKHNCENMGKK